MLYLLLFNVGATLWKASFISETEGSFEIELYALDNQNTVHINEVLVLKKFAAYKGTSYAASNCLKRSFEMT